MFKNKSLIANYIGILFGLLAIILYAVTNADGENANNIVYLFVILGLLFAIGVVVLNFLGPKYRLVADVLQIVSTVFYVIGLAIFLSVRIYWIVDNAGAHNRALVSGEFVVAVVFFILTIVAGIVAGFLRAEKK